MPRLIWVFAGRTVILLVLSCGGSNVYASYYTNSLFEPSRNYEKRTLLRKGHIVEQLRLRQTSASAQASHSLRCSDKEEAYDKEPNFSSLDFPRVRAWKITDCSFRDLIYRKGFTKRFQTIYLISLSNGQEFKSFNAMSIPQQTIYYVLCHMTDSVIAQLYSILRIWLYSFCSSFRYTSEESMWMGWDSCDVNPAII